MELRKGYLVRKDGGELGIITGIGHRQGKAIVFWGDGLESETECECLEPVLYHPKADIVADFIELVSALEHERDSLVVIGTPGHPLEKGANRGQID